MQNGAPQPPAKGLEWEAGLHVPRDGTRCGDEGLPGARGGGVRRGWEAWGVEAWVPRARGEGVGLS